MEQELKVVKKQILQIKMQLLDTEDPAESINLSSQLLDLQRQELVMVRGDKSEYVQDEAPAPRRRSGMATAAELQRLRGECESLSHQILKAQKGEDTSQIEMQLAEKQAEIAQIRSESNAIRIVDEQSAKQWWDSVPKQRRIDLLVELMEAADEHEDARGKIIPGNAGMVGFYKAQIDFVRSGRDVPLKHLVSIWRRMQ